MREHHQTDAIHARFQLHRNDFTLDVDITLPATGVSVLFGHSGSGKTSLLRCIAGLEKADTGKLTVNGTCWQSEKKFLPPYQRPIGYVFQEASLFNHLTARGNLNYAVKRAPKTDKPIDFDHAVTLLGIENILERRAEQLSGGERQRVAIARALLIQPRLLLMDEPLAALDLPRKQEILPYLEQLKHILDLPIIYVSHATDEVARLADYLVAMENGRAVAAGTLGDTLSRLDFPIRLGEDVSVVLSGTVIARDEQWQLAQIAFPGGTLWLRDAGHPLHNHVRVRILARDISLAKEQHNETSIANILQTTIVQIADDEHAGLALVRLKVELTEENSKNNKDQQANQSHFISRITRRSVHTLGLNVGQPIWAQIKSAAII